MSSTRPVPGDRQLPRGHLLVLNRSVRRTLEAENKRPRTIEAYTDAVRLLASYCQATATRSSPTSSTRAPPGLHRRSARPLEAGHRPQPPPGLHAFFKWAVAEGDLATSPMEG